MTFDIRELPLAQADKRAIVEWIADRSRVGAKAWLEAYDQLIDRLETGADSFGWADENDRLDQDVRQGFFRTRRGRTYRVVFLIEDHTTYVLRIRGPGQAPLKTDDL